MIGGKHILTGIRVLLNDILLLLWWEIIVSEWMADTCFIIEMGRYKLTALFFSEAPVKTSSNGGIVMTAMTGSVLYMLFWLLILGLLLIGLTLLLLKPFTKGDDEAMKILRERFARGEIDQQEFEERKKVLQHKGN